MLRRYEGLEIAPGPPRNDAERLFIRGRDIKTILVFRRTTAPPGQSRRDNPYAGENARKNGIGRVDHDDQRCGQFNRGGC